MLVGGHRCSTGIGSGPLRHFWRNNKGNLVNNRLYIDIETNGFNPDTIWCCCWKLLTPYGDSEGTAMCSDDLVTLLDTLGEGTEVYAHNGLRFDFPILGRLWGISWDLFELKDTLVLSKLAKNPREGGHSLAAWGQRLGFSKGDHSDWSRFSPAMLDYCKQDVTVLVKVHGAIEAELKEASEAALLETQVAQIIQKQRQRGWLLNLKKCFFLLAELKERKDEIESTVRQRFVPFPKAGRRVTPKVTKDGVWSRVGLGDIYDSVGGPFTFVDYSPFNLGSRLQIGEYLVRFGWNPTTFTPTGRPIVDEGTLESVDIPEAKLIYEYLMLEKRIAMIQSWVDAADEEDRVHGEVDTLGAVTHRMTHSNPNMAQVTSSRKPYGKELRECWIVPEGYSLVGADADALELRLLAHYMNDPSYIEAVSEGTKEQGTDVHTLNQRIVGLPTRDIAKTFIYAFIYGAGNAKIAQICGRSEREGGKIKESFLDGLPALRSLQSRVQGACKRGYLKGLDGRTYAVRSAHSGLNVLLQGAGALVMKRALVILDTRATQEHLVYSLVGNIHDEIQAEVKTEDAPRFAQLAEESIREAGEYYNLRCPMKGTATIGKNWYETH